jgi:hypothetical protein
MTGGRNDEGREPKVASLTFFATVPEAGVLALSRRPEESLKAIAWLDGRFLSFAKGTRVAKENHGSKSSVGTDTSKFGCEVVQRSKPFPTAFTVLGNSTSSIAVPLRK